MHRRWPVAVVALAALGMAACRPITVDGLTGDTIDSLAELKVVPATYGGEDAIEIRIRACATIVVTNNPGDDVRLSQRPYAMVRDANGDLLFQNLTVFDGLPAPDQVDDQPGDAGLDRILVPVEGAPTPLDIQAGCTSYPGYGQAPYLQWNFAPCITSDRTCARIVDGEAIYGSTG